MRFTMNTVRTAQLWLPLLAAMLFAGQLQAAANDGYPDIQQWETKNGSQVLYVHAPELPMVDVKAVFDAGGARDGGKGGMALLTNALLSEGAGDLTADAIAEHFESVGAQFGTSSHRDMAVASLRTLTDPELMKPAVDTLALLLAKPTFPKSNFERERKRLLIGLQAEKESPGEIADRAFNAALFGDHPYATMPEGTEESVKALQVSDLKSFHKTYYVAKNAIIAIVGDVDRKEAERIADTVTAKLPAGKHAEPLPSVPALKAGNTIHLPFPSKQAHIVMGQPGMTRDDPDYFPLYVGNHILGGSGLVSRLAESIREKRGLSYSTYSYFSPMRRQGPYELGLQTRSDQAQKALALLREEVEKFVNQGPTEAELNAAKKNITGGFPLRLSSNDKIVDYIAMIGFYDLPLDYLNNFSAKVEAVTLKDVRDAFQRRVHPDAMVTVVVGPPEASMAKR